jgi:hypothetical protein
MMAACFAAGLGLMGCDSSVESVKTARENSAMAARMAASAGKPRATDKLYEKVESTPLSETQGIAGQIQSAYGQYIEQQPAEKDLQKALSTLAPSLSAEFENASLKSVLHAQAGSTNLALAGSRLQQLHKKLADLISQVAVLSDLTQSAVDLGAQADALASLSKTAASGDLDKATATVAEKQKAADEAAAKVAQLQQQMDDKLKQAADIEQRTEAAFNAADSLKGQEAIDAGKKAIEEQKQASALRADAGALEPQLADAKGALNIAQVQLADAQSRLKTQKGTLEESNTWAKQNTDRIASLREEARQIVTGGTDAKNSIAERYKKIIEAATAFGEDVKAAESAANAAQSAYGTAASELSASLSNLKTIVADKALDSSDSLAKASNEQRGLALLYWSQAIAGDQQGRIQTVGYLAANAVSALAAQMAAAYKSAGLPASSVDKSPLAPDTFQTPAVTAFTSALSVEGRGTGMSSPEMDRLKWLGYGVQAMINQGLSEIADKAQADDARTKAKSAATNAVTRNPEMAGMMERLGLM